jgi:hypothetical protein
MPLIPRMSKIMFKRAREKTSSIVILDKHNHNMDSNNKNNSKKKAMRIKTIKK